MSTKLRNLTRTVSLIVAVGLLAYGMVSGIFPDAPTRPPDDLVWLICVGLAFPLLLIYAMLTIAVPNLQSPTLNPQDARFRRNVQQLGGFLLVGFTLLSLHLLREQIVAASAVKGATVTTNSGAIIQDPRKIPEQLRVRRGSIYAGDKVIAASEVISPSRLVHRVYPEPNISYLTGYYNPTIYGSAGLEASYDPYLSGKGALDPLLEQQRRILHRPIVGDDVHLTIDSDLQNLAQEALGERNGAVVLLDAQSGAILAMASWPHIDPQQLSFNPYSDYGAENQRIIDYYATVTADPNKPLVMRATQGLYPPGSTFKTVSASAAIDAGATTPKTVFTDTNGSIQVEAGGYEHTDCPTCRPSGHGSRYTLTEGYKWSLNVVFAELGVELGADRITEYADRFGFGTRYDIGLPVEASALAPDTNIFKKNLNALAATAYGQGQVQATPLQMALVAAAVAHGGELPAPYIVASINDQETGKPLLTTQPRNIRRTMSAKTASEVKQMMLTSIESGWAKGANIQGYKVGGKTGTAETGRGTAHSWFIGFAGKDAAQPRYAIAVIVEEGGEGTRVALPVARQVLVAALGTK